MLRRRPGTGLRRKSRRVGHGRACGHLGTTTKGGLGPLITQLGRATEYAGAHGTSVGGMGGATRDQRRRRERDPAAEPLRTSIIAAPHCSRMNE